MASIQTFLEQLPSGVVSIVVVMAGALLAALLVRTVVFRIIMAIASRTGTGLDDAVILTLRNPVVYSLILGGIAWSLALIEMPDSTQFLTQGRGYQSPQMLDTVLGVRCGPSQTEGGEDLPQDFRAIMETSLLTKKKRL